MGLLSTLGTLAGSFFGPVGGSIGGALGGFFDDKGARSDAAQTNAQSYAQNRQMRQTAYQDTVGDLKAAGLNPMMAYSQGATQGQAAPVLNKGLSAAQQEMNSAQAMNLRADTANKAAQAEQIRAQTDLLIKQSDNTVANTAKVGQETLNLEQTRQNLVKQGYNLTEVGNLTRAQVELNRITQLYTSQQIGESEARQLLTEVETKLRRLQIKGAENLEEFEKVMDSGGGNTLRIIQLIRSIMR